MDSAAATPSGRSTLEAMPTNNATCTSMQVVLGVLCFGFFQISGGNPRFVEFSDGLSAMARLAFGYLDWDDFYNGATGRPSIVSQYFSFLGYCFMSCRGISGGTKRCTRGLRWVGFCVYFAAG